MIFCGDISLSKIGAIKIENLPDELKQKKWFGNLEGTFINESEEKKNSLLELHGVFNSFDAIKDLIGKIPFCGFGLANNHIFNYGNVETSVNQMNLLNLPYVGIGYNLEESSRPIVIKDEKDIPFTIFAFSWKLTESIVAKKDREGVNPFTRKHALNSVKKAVKQGKKNVVCFVHWNYEMNFLPFPYDRKLAQDLIDAGAIAVIGCHSHRVGPFEIYKNKPIVYGLGNFLFENNTYFHGKLNFPEISEAEYAFEIREDGNYFIHVFNFDTKKNILNYVKSISLTSVDTSITNLSNISAEEYEIQYIKYFKSKPLRQRILCPIFKTQESKLSYWLKERERDLHEILIRMALKTHIHGNSKVGKDYK